jgi:hypothetical protein
MKYTIVLLFVTLLQMIQSSEKLRKYWGGVYNYENNKIWNSADSNASGKAINYGYKGFAQANPTAVSANTNIIH